MARYFAVKPDAISCLAYRDKRLAWAMAQLEIPRREIMPDIFSALLHTIVGQQVSARVQTTVWNKLCTSLGSLTPARIYLADTSILRACGLSSRKVACMKEAASRIVRGELDMALLKKLSDEEVCTALTVLPGVGRWTAEMLLIFSLERPNILSFGDHGIRRGLRMLYGHTKMNRSIFEQYRLLYHPYATVASFYLWMISSGAIPELDDPAA